MTTFLFFFDIFWFSTPSRIVNFLNFQKKINWASYRCESARARNHFRENYYKCQDLFGFVKKCVYVKSRHSITVKDINLPFFSTYSTLNLLSGCTINSESLYFHSLYKLDCTLPLICMERGRKSNPQIKK